MPRGPRTTDLLRQLGSTREVIAAEHPTVGIDADLSGTAPVGTSPRRLSLSTLVSSSQAAMAMTHNTGRYSPERAIDVKTRPPMDFTNQASEEVRDSPHDPNEIAPAMY